MTTPTYADGRRDPDDGWYDDDEFDDDYEDEEYDDFVPVRRGGRGGIQMLRVVGVIAVIVAIIAAAMVVWVMRQLDPPGDPGEQIALVSIPEGAGVSGIADQLEREGVIANATVFEWYTRVQGDGGSWKAGDYVSFRKNSAVSDAVDVLDEGPVPPQAASVTIPPGMRLADALVKIDDAFPNMTLDQLVAALNSGKVTSKYLPAGSKNFEGLLAPDTYQFDKDSTPEQVLQVLADQAADVLDEAGYARAEALSGRSAYELITIASMIEREAGTPPDERGKVARTIENRLEKKQPLGVDATNLYGLNRTKGALTKAELEQDGPYNTRTRAGLPPTPISLPSAASLQAAIQPPAGPWLYYVLVSNDPPTHMFTGSYDEFLDAKKQAQEDGVF